MTQLWGKDAIAVRWPLLGNVSLTKAQLFSKLAYHRDLCKTSDSRPFLQEDGSTKPVRCTVVMVEAFSKSMRRSLKEGIYRFMVVPPPHPFLPQPLRPVIILSPNRFVDFLNLKILMAEVHQKSYIRNLRNIV